MYNKPSSTRINVGKAGSATIFMVFLGILISGGGHVFAQNLPPTAGTTTSSITAFSSPASGVTWTQGSTETIQWATSTFSQINQPGLSLYENGTYVALIAAVPNTGSYSWTIPIGTYIGSNFQIESYLGNGQYAVSGMFSITAQSSPGACPMYVPYCPYGGHSVVGANGCTQEVCNATPATSSLPLPNFTLAPTVPEITGITPASGGAGTAVTLTGINFGGSNEINVGAGTSGKGTYVTVSGVSSNGTNLSFTMPSVPGATSVEEISVENANGTSNVVSFTLSEGGTTTVPGVTTTTSPFSTVTTTTTTTTTTTVAATSTGTSVPQDETFLTSLESQLQTLEAQVTSEMENGTLSGTEIQNLAAQLQSIESQLTTTGGEGSTSTQCYTFESNLSFGMSGNAVAELQTALQKDGESVQVTGTFDAQTESAVIAFQEKYGSQILTPNGLSSGTGYVGKATRAELNLLFSCTGGSNPVTPTSSSPVACPMYMPYCPYGGHSVVESNGCSEEVCNQAPTSSTP